MKVSSIQVLLHVTRCEANVYCTLFLNEVCSVLDLMKNCQLAASLMIMPQKKRMPVFLLNLLTLIFIPPLIERGLYCNHLVRLSVVHTFVTDISASTRRNDFIFDIWLWHGDLYRVSPFQVYHTSTSCLPCDLQMNEWGYSQHDIACNIFLVPTLKLYYHFGQVLLKSDTCPA